nr:MAG TPA: hypothetical protein [Bacteriophage sp.]
MVSSFSCLFPPSNNLERLRAIPPDITSTSTSKYIGLVPHFRSA